MMEGLKMGDPSTWSCEDVEEWLRENHLDDVVINFTINHVDGITLLLLTEKDISQGLGIVSVGRRKKIWLLIEQLKELSTFIPPQSSRLPCSPSLPSYCSTPQHNIHSHYSCSTNNASVRSNFLNPNINVSLGSGSARKRNYSSDSQTDVPDNSTPRKTSDTFRRQSGVATQLRAEYVKTLISCLYMFLVTWITAIVMVFVHDRVPDRERHPPLPDIFLDNVPHISWAFQLCEITILLLTTTWIIILYFHKHRSILLRRFCALSGSVFLLRCATMFITSLSVPGHHLQCAPRDPSDFWTKLDQAWIIWQGGGLSIKGVRTCGDYMFSGHTTALTVLNFFITEYTPRRMYYLHIASWVLNTFGIFFILAAHEHYSIDVFIAFYITSRMFLYYHSLANNRALHQRDSFRTKIWFPMFSYFEAHIDGIVPNEYSNPLSYSNLTHFWKDVLEPFKNYCEQTLLLKTKKS